MKIDLNFKYTDILPPYAFSRIFLKTDLYPWQIKAQEAVAQRLPTALCAANESGKTTTVVAPLALWFLYTFGDKGGKVVITSGSWNQLKNQLMPAIRRKSHILENWTFLDTVGKHNKLKDNGLVCFSTKDAGRAEGFHAAHEKNAPLFVIIDEAKSVPDSIFEAIDRCRPQYLLITSSPGSNSGKFFRIFNEERSFFYTIKVSYKHCPHIPLKNIERDKAIYGEDSPIFRSMRLGEFAQSEEFLAISPSIIESCLENPPAFVDGQKCAFCDFAAGSDENVLAIRQGNKVWIESAWRDSNTTRAAQTFLAHFKRLGLCDSQIFADESGLGKVICDIFAENNFFVQRVNNGSPSSDKHYFNKGAYIWFKARRIIEKKEIILPDDKIFFAQATTRQTLIKPNGKLALEPKEQMANRGLHSPDRADAIFGAISLNASARKRPLKLPNNFKTTSQKISF